MSIIATLTERIASRRRQALDGYGELVAAAAGDRKFSEARALDILEGAGKTLEDLERDQQQLRQRREWAQQLAAGDELKAKAARLQTENAADVAEKQKAVRKFDERIAAQNARLLEINQQLVYVDVAGDKLRKSMPAELRQRLAHLREQRCDVMPRLKQLRSELPTLERNRAACDRHVAETEKALRSRSDPLDKQRLQQRLERDRQSVSLAQQRLDDHRGQMARLETRLAGIDREEAAIDAEALNP